MPNFQFREWLVGLIVAVLLCFALTSLAARGVGWMRPLAWVYAGIQFLNALGHTLGTIAGHTVEAVRFARPAPGFYSSPFLFAASGWLMVRLWGSGKRRKVLDFARDDTKVLASSCLLSLQRKILNRRVR